jgi:hypothetical protein
MQTVCSNLNATNQSINLDENALPLTGQFAFNEAHATLQCIAGQSEMVAMVIKSPDPLQPLLKMTDVGHE